MQFQKLTYILSFRKTEWTKDNNYIENKNGGLLGAVIEVLLIEF